MNRLFIQIISKIRQYYPPRDAVLKAPLYQLGRWNIDYCKAKTNIKIDLANIDHCGPCGLSNSTKLPNSKP
jgi:hypothetical protein